MLVPALLTRISTRPSLGIVFDIWSGSEASHIEILTLPPKLSILPLRVNNSLSVRLMIIRSAPASEIAIAQASPNPLPAPVTKAVRPSSLNRSGDRVFFIDVIFFIPRNFWFWFK